LFHGLILSVLSQYLKDAYLSNEIFNLAIMALGIPIIILACYALQKNENIFKNFFKNL
jgi:hypothetical protein